MRAGVITFPGSNCDRDLAVALAACGARVERLWHQETELPALDLIVRAGRLLLRRLSALRRDGGARAGDARGGAAGGRRRGRARHLQRLSDPGRGGPAAGRSDQQRRPEFVCRCVELEVATTARPCSPPATPPASASGCRSPTTTATTSCDAGGLEAAARTRTGSRSATATTQRLDRRHRRRAGPRAQRAGHDAAPRARRRPAHRRHRRPAAVPLPARGAGLADRWSRSRPRSSPSTDCAATEYARILEILGRAPNLLELGIFSVMWSEHCSYKSSKSTG